MVSQRFRSDFSHFYTSRQSSGFERRSESDSNGSDYCAETPIASASMLSDREAEILKLLTQGYRDRDIAEQLIISESTVKFHLNNVLSKLKARTRYQALHQAIAQGWI